MDFLSKRVILYVYIVLDVTRMYKNVCGRSFGMRTAAMRGLKTILALFCHLS